MGAVITEGTSPLYDWVLPFLSKGNLIYVLVAFLIVVHLIISSVIGRNKLTEHKISFFFLYAFCYTPFIGVISMRTQM